MQAERFVAVRECGRQPPGERAGHAARRPRRRIPRFQPDELVEIADGPLVLPGDGEDEPPVLERQRIARIEPDRLVEVLEGPLQVALAAMRVPAIVEGRRMARVEPDGLVVVLHRPVQLAPAGIRVAPIAEGEGHGGVETDQLAAVGKRVVLPATVGHHQFARLITGVIRGFDAGYGPTGGRKGVMSDNIAGNAPLCLRTALSQGAGHSYSGEHQDREMDVIAPVPAREVHGRRCAAF